MGALVHKACQTEDFWFLIDMLKRMKIHEVEPDPKLLLELETFVTDTKQIIVNQVLRKDLDIKLSILKIYPLI